MNDSLENRSLVIVQDVPTQFDVPLYNKIADEASFSLLVIYTQTATEDLEIGRLPKWDHIREHRYQHYFLNKTEPKHCKTVIQRIVKLNPRHVIISGYWPKLHRSIMLSLKSKGVSVGLRSDNTIRHSRLHGMRGLLKRMYLRRLLVQYNTWHPVGQQAADYLQYLAGETMPISFFPYNVDNNWFHQNARLSRDERLTRLTKLGFPEGSFIVLGVMKWSKREDPMTLLRGFEQYVKHNRNARLILIGDGPLSNEVKGFTKRIENHVYLPGYVNYSSLPGWYGLADVFVHPAPNEPWGVSISEALASGVPVIASTGVGAAIEQLSPGVNGLIFKQCDVKSLLRALKKWQLVSESKSYDDIALACRSALDFWNYETTIQNFETVLKYD